MISLLEMVIQGHPLGVEVLCGSVSCKSISEGPGCLTYISVSCGAFLAL